MEKYVEQTPESITHEQTLMPVNIKQILDAWRKKKHGFIVINNNITPTVSTTIFFVTNVWTAELNPTHFFQVKVIGKIKGKQMDEYKGLFKIDDCTGTIDASLWFTSGRTELEIIP
jgi:hypothetical protein